jgi:PTH1 family peptidyl-tRNA hydrolase
MISIIGLGNPGKKFKRTRHNLGFMIVESLKSKIKSFSDWKNIRKFQSKISKGKISGKKIILAKPQTFMNNSGKAVRLLIKNYKLKIENLIVIHDDLDLPLGKIKISVGRGSAGHKGVQSIINELGTKNFIRFRLGIKPKQTGRPVYGTENFVLQKFKKEEKKILKKVIKRTCQAIEMAIKEGIEKAMQEFNK